MIFKPYNSLAELVTAAHGPSEMPDSSRASRDKPASERQGNRNSWAGGSWENASKLAQNGDMDGARRLAPTILQAVNSFIHGQKRLDPEYRLDEGQWIDVARFVKGEPECWGAMVEADPVRRRGVTVVLNVAIHANVSPSEIDQVGISVGGAILGLQAAGQTVTLYAVQKIEGYSVKEPMLISAPVNPGASSLDVGRLSIVLRPWFLRRIIFSLEETYDPKIRRGYGIGCGYGRPSSVTIADVKRITGNDDKVVIINVEHAVRNPDGVRDLILRQTKGE